MCYSYSMKWNIGVKNGNWKGGRTVMSSGYVGVRVPDGHHLRMNNGYAYEHRMVAEEKLGRKLGSEEIVHHIDGNKTNNSPDNIEVLKTRFHHKVEHRTSGKERRMPGETNPMIVCACGCGRHMFKFDQLGRARKYWSGHFRRVKTARTHENISCACGCGAVIDSRDKYGRLRRFISGHNARSK